MERIYIINSINRYKLLYYKCESVIKYRMESCNIDAGVACGSYINIFKTVKEINVR
jgi:hypothetical protein